MKPPVKRLSRVEQQHRTRRALLDAAVALFVQRGVEATTIEEVTALAGYSRGAFYSNFESKEDLFLEASRHFFEELLTAASPGPQDLAEEEGRRRFEALRAVADDRASVFIAEACLFVLRHPELREAFAEIHRRQLGTTIAFVEEGLRRYGITEPAVPVEMLANITQAASFGLHLKELVDPSVRAAESAGSLLALVLKGLAS